MNKGIMIGNLTRDPESGTTQNGVSYTHFTIAVKKRFHGDGEPDSDFMRVTAWRALAENCAKYLSKGKKVAVTGTVGVSCYMGNDNEPHAQIEITAEDVEFLSPAGNSGAPAR